MTLPSDVNAPSDETLQAEGVYHLAEALGFMKVAFLPEAPRLVFPSEELTTWLTQGYHASMHWMTHHQDKRVAPAKLVAEDETLDNRFTVESILVVTMNYAQDLKRSDTTSPKIARYARGRDYHRVIKKKLQTLLKQLQGAYPNLQGRAFTDSAPMLERAMAVHAGLGWQGKHCNVISPQHGSYFFIGSLFLSLPVSPQPQPIVGLSATNTLPDFCGTCRRCIDACPTEALFESPRQLDANRCIAYWTIEATHTQAIPSDIASRAEGWIFGCDICQEVCPWNIKFAVPTQEADFLTPKHPWQQYPEGTMLAQFSETSFKEAMAGTPLMRAGLERLQHTWRHVIGDERPTTAHLSSKE
ncbi:MAG: tRNA epoxyqueuosine(34) reductase QueG [Vampirovibrionales bacterium]